MAQGRTRPGRCAIASEGQGQTRRLVFARMPIIVADNALSRQPRESRPRTIRRLCHNRACHTGSPDLIDETE